MSTTSNEARPAPAAHRPLALVVEDEPDVAEYIAAVLTDEGFRVIVAADGIDATRQLRAHRPDLVTLDISLPEQSGVRCYREIKEDAELAATPVVMVTGVHREFKRFIHRRRQVPPPEGFVAKPFTAAELLEAVRGALARRAGVDTERQEGAR